MTIKDLDEMIRKMEPTLIDGKYFMVSISLGKIMRLGAYMTEIICLCYEEEGYTVVFTEDVLKDMVELAEQKAAGPFTKITLNVYSDLMSVGFIAKVSGALADKGISVNSFSGYHHDHLLVPFEKREEALQALEELSKNH